MDLDLLPEHISTEMRTVAYQHAACVERLTRLQDQVAKNLDELARLNERAAAAAAVLDISPTQPSKKNAREVRPANEAAGKAKPTTKFDYFDSQI